MKGLGAPQPAPGYGQPGGDSSHEIPLWVVLVSILVALTLVGLLALSVLGKSSAKSGQSATHSATRFPAQWDSRIAPYARIAAKLRGLNFHHPVPVRFLSSARFEKTLTKDQSQLSKRDRIELEHATGLFRAFGLISGDVDLYNAISDFDGGAVLAYYSFDDHRITVRGHKVTPSVRATLVHELTHVLQDQHFHVGVRLKKLEKQSVHGPDSAASGVLDAIVEGDAQRVEHLYRDSLSAKQRRRLDAGQQGEAAQARTRLERIPQVVITLESSPYDLGEGLVQTVAANRGNAAVNQLLVHPPTHESALLDPFKVLAGAKRGARVAVPTVQAGEKKFDSGELGVLTWYFMLAERLPLQQALAAADGWGGDAYVGFERDGTTCARIAYTGHAPEDTTRMYAALQGWVAAAPRSPASVSLTGDVVHFESCDPGTTTQVGRDDSLAAMTVLTTRTLLGVQLMHSGLASTNARCLSGRLIQAFPVSQLTDPNFGKDNPAAQARVQQLAADCRSSTG
jgi:hypothetical protein